MLDFVRRHATSWLVKVALFLIIIVFIFWGGYTYQSLKENQIAQVGDHYISIRDYNDAYNHLVENYRRRLGPGFSEEMIKRFNVKQQALDQLINHYLVMDAARKMGIVVTDREIQQRVLEFPVFQVDGRFDQKRYVGILHQNHLTPEAFEQQLADEICWQRVEAFVGRRALVTEEEVRADFRFNQTRIQLAYIIFDPRDYEAGISLDETAVQAFYQQHREEYKDPEKRRICYAILPLDDYLSAVTVSEDEMRQYYEDRNESFRYDEEVRARHVLVEVKPNASEEEEAGARAEAEKILQQARKGTDFAELARKYSKDTGSAKKGGDLGFFTRRKMVREFAEAAFNMKPGEISDLVRTEHGFHVIKVEEVRPERVEPFEEVKNRIEESLKKEKARDLAFKKARELSDLAYAQRDLGKAAESLNLAGKIREETLSVKDAIPGLDPPNPEIVRKIFALSEKETSDPMEYVHGFLVAQVLSVHPPEILPLEKVRERVEKELREEKARLVAEKDASDLLAEAKKLNSLDQAGKSRKLEVRRTEWFSRSDPDKKLKLPPDSGNAVFQLEPSNPFPETPLDLRKRVVVCQLLGKTTPAEIPDIERQSIVKRLRTQKQAALWQSWMEEQRRKAKIKQFREL